MRHIKYGHIHADCEKHVWEVGDGLENVLDSLFS